MAGVLSLLKHELDTMINSSFINQYQKRDEYYTPKILVDAILKYIPIDKTIWCPFDTANSEFVLALKARGNTVVYSHIKEGLDFFDYEPCGYDYIVSNPLSLKNWMF